MTFSRSTLNEDQFTLSCISTGGPATNVAWTRDFTPVAEGSRTFLNDPVTAQYTHTLAVTTAGEYTCTVSNNKPSSDSATLRVQGKLLASFYWLTASHTPLKVWYLFSYS